MNAQMLIQMKTDKVVAQVATTESWATVSIDTPSGKMLAHVQMVNPAGMRALQPPGSYPPTF